MIRVAFHHLLSSAAAHRPDSLALTFKQDSVTYAETWQRAQGEADQLLGLGLEAGDRVAIYLEKRLETVVAMFAASAAGGVFVPINPVLKPLQVGHILANSGARFLITTSDRLPQLEQALSESDVQHVIVVGSRPASAPPSVVVHEWSDPQGATLPGGGDARVDLDPAAILYTSGSTGRPKGVVLSHRNLIVGAESVSTYLRNTADDVILSVLPLSFDAGLSQVTTAFAAGAHCVLMNYLLPREVPKLCAKHGVTGLTGVPPLWLQLLDVPWPQGAAQQVRYFANTGGRMPRTTLERLRRLFAEADPFLMYGLTEAFRSTYLDPAEVDRRPHSIGKAIPNAEILVLRPDGTQCDPGEEGELVHRGPLVALGYWNDPVRTAERYRPIVRPGQDWRTPEMAVWSGDTVVADEEGFLYFVGRSDDMIKTSGYRVSPTEIEEAAYATGLVRDAVAIGVDDPNLGQRIMLTVTSKGSALDVAELMTALRQQLPLYMVPAQVDVREEMPRSPNGKFDRNLIKSEVFLVKPHEHVASFGMVDGELRVGGVPLTRLAARVGSTPFFAYDRALLDARIDQLRAALPSPVELSFAMKANPMAAVVQHLARRVDRIDVASSLEMLVALDTTISPDHVSFAGPGKTSAELRQAVAAGVIIEVESTTEFDRVVAAGEDLGVTPSVAVRVNPDFAVKGSGMRMGGGPQQFGIDAEAVPAVLSRYAAAGVDVVGFHVFAGSQNLNAEIIAESQRRTVELVTHLAGGISTPLRYLNLGGGFGIPYTERDRPLDLTAVAERLHTLVDDVIAPRFPGARTVIELGRYIVGECGVYVTKVVDRKVSRGRTYLVVDGGMHHQLAASGNFGQAIRRNYPLAVGNRAGEESLEVVNVVGCLCTPLDLLGDNIELPPAQIDDLIVIFQQGAYGLTASPTAFLGHPPPREVLV